MSKEAHADFIQCQIDNKLLTPFFCDMKELLGDEMTEVAALIDVLTEQFNTKLNEFPDYASKMKDRTLKRIVKDENIGS